MVEVVSQEIVDKDSLEIVPKRLTSEELYGAFVDSLYVIYQKAVKSVNYSTGELEISKDELFWSSKRYKDLFWYLSDFEFSVEKKQVGDELYYLTSCLKEGSEINIFGFLLLEKQSSGFVLKDSAFNIINEKYVNDTWTFNYYLATTQDKMPIVVFEVGQGEETVAYRETIALFDITQRKLIGENIVTKDSYDGMEEIDSYSWKSKTYFSDTSFVNGYPDFTIVTIGTFLEGNEVVEYNNELKYKFNPELGRYKQ